MYAERVAVLCETLRAIEERGDEYHALAAANLRRWAAEARQPSGRGVVELRRGDWGEVALAATKEHGAMFACLNMANAYVPGGGYVEGCPAQEENMFRRTDCHFSIDRARDLHGGGENGRQEEYTEEMTDLLNAKHGRVYLDSSPRVCIRGLEQRGAAGLGYAWLDEEEVFPFLELRAAAVDLRDGSPFDPEETRARIRAQLDTLSAKGVRHAVLSAFGCGAFQNPADQVASIYKEELEASLDKFDKIIFAIFDPGYPPDNFVPFEKVFGEAAVVN